MLHVHSHWSDGKNSIREMALQAKSLGFEYIAICDHSQAAAYARGLTIEQLKQQQEEIDNLNHEGLGIHILKGVESDILHDGSLDYPDNILESFDLIVASVHSGFKMPKDEMTKRMVRALENPFTTILGHPTGRLLLARPAYEVDIHELIDTAVKFNKVIEINANPYRLDLSWENARYAKEKGMKTAINPDSHETGTLTDIYYGINVARKAWLGAEDVINCLPYKDFKKILRKK
jgi:DNA polymerase (family 10)